MIFLNETKLNNQKTDLLYKNNFYTSYRRDRDGLGGGILVFVKNGVTIKKYSTESGVIENIYIQLKIQNKLVNFISCYKPPDYPDSEFLDELEDLLFSIDPSEPLFIIGDLNMDLLSSQNGEELSKFLLNNSMVNYVKTPTRIHSTFQKKNQNYRCDQSLIDVVIHNDDFIEEVKVVPCPFSDHQFVSTFIKINKPNLKFKNIQCRNLCEENLIKINNEISSLDFKFLTELKSIDDKWLSFKNLILSILDKYAPLKEKTVRNSDQFGWYDDQLYSVRAKRDKLYKVYAESKSQRDFEAFQLAKSEFEKLNNQKLIEYFKDKTLNNFKNSKKYYEFYSSLIKIKSNSKSNNNPLSWLKSGENLARNDDEIRDLFNEFFTTIHSSSTKSLHECLEYSNSRFQNLIDSKVLNPSSFKFSLITSNKVSQLINELESNSGPGFTQIPTKIFKLASQKLSPILGNFINHCIVFNQIPKDWKTAIVTPLYKNKGDVNDVNNYRAISVLPPVTKIFEKFLESQITSYLNKNNLLCEDQHGFRFNRSCESAMHELLSKMNEIRSKRLIGLFLFIDFKKAFDTVNPKLLLNKIALLGFELNSIRLLENYFYQRTQCVKFANKHSKIRETSLGVPQGSVLGPLFFLIFINDISCYIEFLCKLFADDTTLFLIDNNKDNLIKKFNCSIEKLIDWCKYNRLDINWNKTKIMFISNKRGIDFPNKLDIDSNEIEVIQSIKILGIIVDNKLNFKENVALVRQSIYKRLYSIKRLFYLSLNVKVQFFKAFIMPYFEYCSTILIYYPKEAIQKLSNTYNLCLYRLFGFKHQINYSNDFNTFNSSLEKLNINCFQHRILKRLCYFIHRLFSRPYGPKNLKDCFTYKYQIQTRYNLRSLNKLIIPNKGKLNNYGECTFGYFYSALINNLILNEIDLKENLFKCRINNINLLFPKFVNSFSKFDLQYKVKIIRTN